MPSAKPKTPSSDIEIERQRLVSLINSMGDGVIAIDKHAKIMVYNGAALNILDQNATMTDKSLPVVLKLKNKKDQLVDLSKLIQQTKRVSYWRDFTLDYSDGSKINLYMSIAPVHLGFGRVGEAGYVVVLRDITREKSLEEERDEFLSVVSHELRTPVAITEGNISNAKYIAERGGSIDQIKEALGQAYNQVSFLAGMINDLATLSRAERGKLAAEVESINAHELVEELIKNYAPDAERKSLKLSSELDPSLELLQSSKLYVREILQNFITNAIKYTETGGVTVAAHQLADGISFEVTDTGIGISRNDQERVFEKFFRSEDYRTRKNSGTGLGLYITQKLAKLINAKMEMESELNKGSTFRLIVPNLKVHTRG